MLIPKETINEIVSKADIVSLISERISLSKKGRNYWGVCPFHQDSNPSMSVSPDKKFFKCFSCQVGGTALDFVQNFDNITFVEAIKKIATQLNIDLSAYETENANRNSIEEDIYKINEEALAFFKLGLISNDGKKAVNYLRERDITLKEIEYFQIGFLPKNSSLVDHLQNKGFSISLIVESGLGNYSEERAKLYDIFSDRIMFTIKNENNKIIGFSGRIIEKSDDRAKYLNTKETKVFSKRKIAYNYSEAIKSARVKKEIVVLEGYMDVISMHKNGIDNAIALMGTALSQYHIDLFNKVKGTVKMFLDGDDPGIQGNIHAAEILIKNNQKMSIVNNNSNLDPDELIKNGNLKEVISMIENAIDPLNYVISKLWSNVIEGDFNSVEEFVKKVCRFVLNCDNQILYDTSFEKIEKVSRLTKDSIMLIYKNMSSSFSTSQNDVYENYELVQEYIEQEIDKPKTINVFASVKSYEMAQTAIINELLKSNKRIELIKDKMHKIKFTNDNFSKALLSIISAYEEHEDYSREQLLEIMKRSTDESFFNHIYELLNNPTFKYSSKDDQKILNDSFEKIKLFANENTIEYLGKKLLDPNLNENDKKILAETLTEKLKKREEWLKTFKDK